MAGGVGIEPTAAITRTPAHGFEVRKGHQTLSTPNCLKIPNTGYVVEVFLGAGITE